MHFVIAGRINCSQYSFAVMVLQRLKENLPEFTYSKIPKKPEDWERWLINICKENDWYHIKSPIIWREIGLKKGKKQLVGDINKFLDLCYDYYGIPRNVLSGEHFKREEMDWFTQRTESEYFEKIKVDANKRRKYRSRQVCITGASSHIAEIIIMELLQLPLQAREDGLEIRLFDHPEKRKKLIGSASDAKSCPGLSGLGNCRVACTLREAFTNIDLVIVLDTFKRKGRESLVKWLKRNRNAMCALGKSLNKYAPPHCRVIIGSPSNQPVCYNATVLASFATKLHVRNIVAVTQDLGREMLKHLTAQIKAPLKNLHCPPVWGFVGLNKYVDVRRTLQKHLYQVPGRRIATQLPQGIEEWVLRTTGCLLNENEARNLHVRAADHKAESFPQLGRMPCLAKATAILDLLKVWGIKQEDGDGEILCLGIYSDGTFNIPQGIYWSQPAILKKGFWVPFPDYPIPRQVHLNYSSLFLYSVAALYRTKVKPRIYVPPKPVLLEKEKKKFDFNKILEEIEMPVIRTDAECVEYLKKLAKEELGIDSKVPSTDIIEEPESKIAPPEEVKKESMFCECWRQELKQLQKIVFDRSSTTEVEIDLSENISGSEFSIINPNMKYSAMDVTSSTVKSSVATIPVSTTSPETICSCGILSDGLLCRCLEAAKSETTDKISTEHFYKDQNAQIFMEDLQDVIYADAYIGEKHVVFNEEAKSENEKSTGYKFYGKKDAIRDVCAELKMKERILKYERGGEESIGEAEEEEREEREKIEEREEREKIEEREEKVEEEEEREETKEIIERRAFGSEKTQREASESTQETQISEKPTEESIKDAKFHISIEGVAYDIIGDQDGLERLDEIQRSRESSRSFREMYIDEIVPSIQVLPPESPKTTKSSSDNTVIMPGEDMAIDVKPYLEFVGEQEESLGSLQEDFNAAWGAWGDSLFYEEKGGEVEGEMDTPKQAIAPEKKTKREGIPLCCLCRCIVPEGLPCCPCGTSKVVEVFKKESIEVFIQSEDDIVFRVEYFETALPPESPLTSETISPSPSPSPSASTSASASVLAPESESIVVPESVKSFTPSTESSATVVVPEFTPEPSALNFRDLPSTPSLSDILPPEVEIKRAAAPIKLNPLLLPPESFFPFVSKPENTFKEPERPQELTKQYMDSFKEKPQKKGMAEKCAELLNLAKAQLEEKKSKESMKEEDEEKPKEVKEKDTDQVPNLLDIKESQEYIKTDFSNLNLFVPHGIEDWRMTVQKKYREWFYQGTKIRDECYYDIAIEEVSDDEFEIDKDIEKYFET